MNFGWKGMKMLVLSRLKDESIMIGDEVEITIVDVRGDKVRLGITAPKHIPVHRREIYDAIQREKEGGAVKDQTSTEKGGTEEDEEPPAKSLVNELTERRFTHRLRRWLKRRTVRGGI